MYTQRICLRINNIAKKIENRSTLILPKLLSNVEYTSLDAMGHFTFWISLSLRPKTETKRLNFGLSPEFRLTNHRGAHHCSLHNVITDVIADIFVFLCL